MFSPSNNNKLTTPNADVNSNDNLNKHVQVNNRLKSNLKSSDKNNEKNSSKSKLSNISEFQIAENDEFLTKDDLSTPKNKLKETIRFTSDQNDGHKHKNRQSALKRENDDSLNFDLYIELEELHFDENHIFVNSCNGDLSNYEWRIKTRWIKYEQTIDPETNIWSKPFVGSLIYQNLILLKNKMQYASIILNSKENTFERIVDEIIQDLINRGQMNRDNKDQLLSIILSQHRNNLTISSAMTGKKQNISGLFSSSHHKHRSFSFMIDPVTAHSSEINNLDSVVHSPLMHSNINNINRSDSQIKNAQNHNEPVATPHEEINQEKSAKNPVKFFISSTHTISNSNERLNNSSNHINHPHRNNFKSTLHSFRKSVMPHHHHHHNHYHQSKSDNSFNKVEAFIIMVGAVDFLDHVIEFGVRVRFLFIFMGPKRDNIDYLEMGRCMGTLMTNKDFHDCAYFSKNRKALLSGITSFSNRSLCLVLPCGEFDEDLLTPLIDWIKDNMKKKKVKLTNNKEKKLIKHPQLPIRQSESDESDLEHNFHSHQAKHVKFDPFKRTRKPFGSLFNEIKYRYKHYVSDIKDGFSLHCLIASIFIFTVCISPALCFGGILAEKSDQWFGINEMLLATSLNGIFFGLFSGQPLMLFGATGPFLVFEEMIYIFLATRIWVALWILVYVLIMLALEGVFIIHQVTRFSEEIFAFLIAIVFLGDALKKTVYYFKIDPIYVGEKYCTLYSNISNSDFSLSYDPFSKDKNFNQTHLVNDIKAERNIIKRWTKCKSIVHTIRHYRYNESMLNDLNPHIEDNHYNNKTFMPEPNIALISFILLIGTCVMALCLKKLRRSNFFGSYIRRTLSDVGILISIILAVGVDILIRKKTNINTQKLDIPENLIPTKSIRKNWFINPFGNDFDEENSSLPIWVPFASSIPAFIIFIVLFFEVELTGIILNAKHRKLKKGSGFNLDLLLGALMMTFNSFFGLPWMCAAPVRTLAHWASLTIYSSSFIPGEKPKLVKIKEQRITNILVHICIALCLKGKFLLKLIPVPVLFGIFLYFGIVSLSGTQLFERIKLILIPFKYCPNEPYAIGTKPSKRNLFTFIQIIAVLILFMFKSYAQLSFVFPIVLLLLVPFRSYFLTRVFTNRELEQLDDAAENQTNDIIHDFYEITHLPI